MCIDGTEVEAQEGYRNGIKGVVDWCEKGGKIVDISDLFGPGRYLCLTRAGGAMDLEVKYKERSIAFLIQGRNLYLRGWKARGNVYELNDTAQIENFTLDPKCIRLRDGLNYGSLVGHLDCTLTGIWHLRNAFDQIWKHAAGQDINISKEVAIFAVHISEATRFHIFVITSVSRFLIQV